MLSITIHDDKTGEMVRLNFTDTGEQLEEGKNLHTIETEWVTDLEAIKKDASPMFKSALYILMNSFGLGQKKEG